MFHMLLLLKRTKTTNFYLSYQTTVTVKVKIQSQLEGNSTSVLIADMLQKPSDGTTEQELDRGERTIGAKVPQFFL